MCIVLRPYLCAEVYRQEFRKLRGRHSGSLPATSTVSATPALCSLSDEQKHAAFFEEFFAPGGQYLRYVNVTSSENPSKEKVKGGFKFGLEVQVLYNNLRNDLQDAGVIRSLSSGF